VVESPRIPLKRTSMTQDASLTSPRLMAWLVAVPLALSSWSVRAEEISSVYTPLDLAQGKDVKDYGG